MTLTLANDVDVGGTIAGDLINDLDQDYLWIDGGERADREYHTTGSIINQWTVGELYMDCVSVTGNASNTGTQTVYGLYMDNSSIDGSVVNSSDMGSDENRTEVGISVWNSTVGQDICNVSTVFSWFTSKNYIPWCIWGAEHQGA